jgi:hypothetical protein
MEAFERSQIGSAWPDGTYELIGPLATEPGTSVNAAGWRLRFEIQAWIAHFYRPLEQERGGYY